MTTASQTFPVRLGTDQEFQALRSALSAYGYTETAACAHLNLKRISNFEIEVDRRFDAEPQDAIGLLARLLIEGGTVSRQAAAGIPVQELANLGILEAYAPDLERIAATVMLYPMRGMFIVSDRSTLPEGGVRPLLEDFVYPAMIPNTELFLDLIPESPCDSFLDLCAGTGIAAMVAARNGARRAHAFDITARSTHFAEFNRRLNRVDNFAAKQGDLYDPAGDRTFDRIVAHPPYLPVYRPQLIFDSGGQDGEQIVRGIIQGLPRYLRPGGRFYALTMGTDREKPFEHRLREWLGDAENEFDIAFVNRRSLSPREYATEALIKRNAPAADILAWRSFFEGLQVQALAYGFVAIQRRDRLRPVFTVRRQTGLRSGPAEHAWLMEWETAVAGGNEEVILASRPRVARDVRLRVVHQIREGEWTPEAYDVEADHPFRMEMRAEAWTAHLLRCADGSLTSAELLEKMKAGGALHPEAPPVEFARMLATLISGGFLQI